MKPAPYRLVGVLALVAAAATAHGGDRPGGLTLSGGAGGGTLPPVPPQAGNNSASQAPVDPTLSSAPSGPVLVQVLAGGRRAVIVRDRQGRVLHASMTDQRGRAIVPAVLAQGALLDILGTDCVGLPVAPGVHVVVPGT